MVTPLSKTQFTDWRGGQNTKLAAHLLGPRELTLARNVWWDARGQIEKRPGYVLTCAAETSPPAAVVHGMGMYYPEGGTPLRIDWRNGAAYSSLGCAATVPTLCTGYSATNIMRMENARNKMIGVNNAGGFLYTVATGALTALGLTVPTGALTAATGAAGVLTGAYTYRVTFEYGTGDRGESNPGPASVSVTATSHTMSLTAIPTGGTGVTRRHIYRTTSGGATHYFLVTLTNNTATTYSDNIADSALGDEVETDNDAPPAASFLAWHKNMMFYAGVAASPKRLYFSKIGNSEQVPALTNFIDVPTPGDAITGLASLNEGLIVFTNEQFFILTGGSPATFRFRVVEKNIGLTASNAIAVHNGAVYFLHHERLYRSYGGPAQYLSDNIDRSWVPSLRANMREARAIVWENRLLIYVFLGSTAYASKSGASDDTAVNNRIFGLDLTLLDQAEDARESQWFEWTNHFPNVWTVAKGPSQNQEILYWGSNRTTGLTYRQSNGGSAGAFADDGAAIAQRVESPDYHQGDVNLVKLWRYFSVIARGASGQTLTPYYALDRASSWSAFPRGGLDMAANDGQLFTARWGLPGQTQGHYCRFALEESSTSYVSIDSWHIHTRPVRDLEGA